MKETYRMMSRLMSKEYEPLTNETLAEKYQQTGDERILATAYVKNAKLFTKICKKYSWVEDEDKATATLTSLEKSLKNFSSDSKVRFGTYLYKATNRALMRATDTMLHKRRNERLNNVSLDTQIFGDDSRNTLETVLSDTTFSWSSVDAMFDCERSKTLTFKEKQFCRICLCMTNPTTRVLRQELSLTPMDLFRLKKSLKQKFLKDIEMEI